VSAGFVKTADTAGRFTATVDVSSAETRAQLGRLQETADELASSIVPDLASNVKLIWACMQALPQILTGKHSQTTLLLQHQLYLCHLGLQSLRWPGDNCGITLRHKTSPARAVSMRP